MLVHPFIFLRAFDLCYTFPMIFCADHLYPELHMELKKVDDLFLLPKVNALYKGIRNHADLLLCPTTNHLFLSQEISAIIMPQLSVPSTETSILSEALTTCYPKTALLNVILTSSHLICNIKAVCSELLCYAKDNKLDIIPVKQGYTRCTTLPLSDKIFLTDDPGMAKILEQHHLTVFKVEANHVKLQHQTTGFIGGTAGVIGDTVYFNGDITRHPSHEIIIKACRLAHLNIIQVPNEPLVDIGSILQYES